MPKKKTHKKKHTTHRKHGRMGALNLQKDQDLLMIGAGVITGAIVKRFADNLIAKQSGTTGVTVSQKTVNVVEALGGAAMFYFLDQPFLRGMGAGLVGGVAYDASKDLKLAGIGEGPVLVPFKVRPQLNGGVTQTPAVAGATAYMFPKPSGVGRMRSYASHLR